MRPHSRETLSALGDPRVPEFFRLSKFLTLLNEGLVIDGGAVEVSGVNNLGAGDRRDDFRADFTGVFAREGWFHIVGVD